MPFPHAEGLALSLKYEHGAKERNFKPAARGEMLRENEAHEKAPRQKKANDKEAVATISPSSWQTVSCSAAFQLPDSSEQQPAQSEWCGLEPPLANTIDDVARAIAQRKEYSDADSATVPSVMPKIHVKAMFV